MAESTHEMFALLRDAIRRNAPVALATIVEGPGTGAKLLVFPEGQTPGGLGTLGNDGLDRCVARETRASLTAGWSGIRRFGPNGEARQDEITVFVESFTPPARMIIFGAVDFTAALVRVAKALGFHVTVCDARETFATPKRFPEADDVVVDWPQRYLEKEGASLTSRDAICILTHDHKFDVPAVLGALQTDVGYIGCMGSRRTHAQRVERLEEAGVTGQQMDRVMSPIGLDIGARTPAETAVSICAEIIAHATGRAVPSLRDGKGPIHGPATDR